MILIRDSIFVYIYILGGSDGDTLQQGDLCHGETVMTSSNRAEMNSLSPCSHEEADTRLMAHALDASLKGH